MGLPGIKGHLLMWLVVALIANFALLRSVHAQAVITLDPSAFAPGTNVSNAFSGVTLSAMSFVPDGTDPVTGVPLYTPVYAPVYAEGNLFAQGPLSTPYLQSGPGLQADFWGEFNQPAYGDCFTVCAGGEFLRGSDLLVSFASPIIFASALQIGNWAGGEDIEAFNSSDQLVASCFATTAPLPIGNYGCYSALNDDYESNYALETSVAGTDITKLLIAGDNQGQEIGGIEAISAPEIDPTSAVSGLTLLLGVLLVLRGRRATF